MIALPERMLEPELQPDEPPNALLIAIIRGRDLPVKDKHLFSKGGSSDPFVTFHVGNESVKSSKIPGVSHCFKRRRVVRFPVARVPLSFGKESETHSAFAERFRGVFSHFLIPT